MSIRRITTAGALALVAILVPAKHRSVAAQAAATPPASDAQWSRVEGGTGTDCSDDSPFAFFVHAGNPRHVMVFFAGGGACWNGTTCDIQGDPTFTQKVGETPGQGGGAGLFDLKNPANPVADYSTLLVPYCTGDLHLGSRDVTYRDSLPTDAAPRSFVIHHQGAQNAASALRWLAANWKAPEIVFVTGSSAGAFPTPVYAAELARLYPGARVVQLGDAGGGVRATTIPQTLAQWGATERLRRDPAYRAIDSARFTYEALYLAAARAAPSVRFAQYNTVEDRTIGFFLNLMGQSVPMRELLAEGLAEIRQGKLDFHSYTAPGSKHTILAGPEFYQLRVDGVGLRDWVAALIEGNPVRDVGDSSLRKAPQ